MTCSVELIEQISNMYLQVCEEQLGGVAGQCDFVTTDMNEALKDFGCGGEVKFGLIGKDGKTTHYWLELSSNKVKNIENGPVIVDPTIKQFSNENEEIGMVDIGLAPSEELPEVGIFTPTDSQYDWYKTQETLGMEI